MKISASIISFTAILAIFGACQTKKTTNSHPEESVPDTTAVVIAEPERLPDTVFASAEKVSYTVDIADTAASGRLNSLVDLYDGAPGDMTFRKGLMRQAEFGGQVDTLPTEVAIDWTVVTEHDNSTSKESMGPWGGGTGWTGQPLFVQWPDSIAQKLKADGMVNENFSGNEVIVASLCGKLYFIDLNSGKLTRQPVDVGNPVKGTPSLDPTLNGNLYVGHGVPGQRPFGAVVVDLFRNEVTDIAPEDPKAWRRWGAYDSSPLRHGQFLFRPAENGGIYKYSVEPGKLKLHSVLRYKVNGAAPGIESSMAIYANYGYVSDNHGNVMAINLDTMKPVWHYFLGDDTDSTPLVAVEDGKPFVYVGCEADRRPQGPVAFVKIDGVDGHEVWRREIDASQFHRDARKSDGGFYASPLLGAGDCEGLIFTNCVINSSGQNGDFMALDRKTGEIRYRTPLRTHAWSSPVGLLTADRKMVIVTGDRSGNVYIIEGKSGNILHSSRIGYNFESSPIVVGSNLIVGSRTNNIFKLSLK